MVDVGWGVAKVHVGPCGRRSGAKVWLRSMWREWS